MLPTILAILIVCLGLLLFSRPRSRKNLVPEGGPRIKNALAWLMVKSGEKRRESWQDVRLADSRVPVPDGVDEEMYNDSFVFQGADADGNVFLTRLGFRNGGREVEIWFWGTDRGERYDNDVKILRRENDPAPESIEAAGLEYSRVKDGEWKISFQGLINGTDGRAELIWKKDSALYFSPDVMNARSTARAMAEMPWSAEYFRRISSEKQVRIEQGGLLTGTVEYGGKTISLNMKGMRDHSWGKRDWQFINRYVWNMLAFDEPVELFGMKAKYMGISPVNYGDSFRRITTGWVAGDDEVKPVCYATDLLHIGNDGVIPEEYSWMVRTPGRRAMKASVIRTQPEMPWILADGGFEVNEAWCSTDIAGVRAFGIAEFGYAADRGYNRPFEVGDKD